MKKTILIICFLVLFSTIAYASDVEYDEAILEEFNTNSMVPVLVRLKDNSNVVIEGTKEEKRALIIQKNDWFKPQIDSVLNTLSEEEFELMNKRSEEFEGKITKQGLDKLIKDNRVKKISLYLTEPGHTMVDENKIEEENKIDEVEPQLLEEEPDVKKESWFILFFKWLFGIN